ncbi:MAG: hypothetical protein AAF846_28625 [Chloroflexota bacterium]
MAEYIPSNHVQEDVMAFLLTSPTPQEIIAFHASDEAQVRLRYLLEANRNGTLSDTERAELDDATYTNRFVMRLKAKARQMLKNA